MAIRVPQPVQQGQQIGSVQAEAANTPFINVRAADTTSALSNDLSALGGAAGAASKILAERNKNNMLREAEEEVRTFERVLNDPETGIARDLGKDAIGATQRATENFDRVRHDMEARFSTAQVGHSGREALQAFLDGSRQRVWNAASKHETIQSAVYEEQLITAGIEGALDDLAGVEPGNTLQLGSMTIALENKVEDLAEVRGLDGEAKVRLMQDYTSEAALRTVKTMVREGNATAAIGYVAAQTKAGNLDQTVAQDILDKITPTAIDEQGVSVAAAAMAAGQGAPGTMHTDDPAAMAVRLHQTESRGSGGPGGWLARNDAVGSSGRKGHFGRLQFSRDRIDDAIRANILPKGTTGEMLIEVDAAGVITPKALQMQKDLEVWHIKDIDKNIKRQGYDKRGKSMDGMRAVQHLGGPKGLAKFMAETGGGIADANGKTLQNYYDTYSGHRAGGAEILAGVADPRVREAAEKAIVAGERAASAAHKRQQGALVDDIHAKIDADIRNDTNKFDLNKFLQDVPDAANLLGDELPALRTLWNKQRTGEELVDNRIISDRLTTMSELEPDEFMGLNLPTFRSELSIETYEDLLDEQLKLKKEAKGESTMGTYTVAQSIKEVKQLFGELKVNKQKNISSLLRSWVEAEEAAGRTPTDVERTNTAQRIGFRHLAEADAQKIGQMIAAFDSPGFDKSSSKTGEVLMSMNTKGMDVFLSPNTDLSLNLIDDNGRPFEHAVSAADRKAFLFVYRKNTGRTNIDPSTLTLLMYHSLQERARRGELN